MKLNESKTMRIHNLECPFCGTDFGYEAAEQLTMDIYNGICVTCDDCNYEYSVDVLTEVTCIGVPKDEYSA